MPWTRLTFLIVALLISAESDVLAQGFTPEQAVARMVLPEGFHAEVFASEPMIRQPVAATFDERGRMWVIEYLQYPIPAGLKPVTVDQYLRTEYDKSPEPPPFGPKGVDRIKVIEDTDGDGKADKETIFLEGLNLASAIAVGDGGVYIGQAPYLLFYPDKNRDDKPDGDPEVLLSGFGLQDAHATVNSMGFGPDGWLYGAQGSTVTAKIRGVEFQQGVWRYHPKTKTFELYAEGGGNTWGLDFDLAGNAFGSSNGGFIAFHMEQGGNYWKGFAKHGPLHNPNTFGYFDSIKYEGRKIGGHVTPGGIIYKGDNFPESFRGKFIGGNLLANAVYWHELTQKGSTFTGKHGGTLIDAQDNWFRPIDLLTGPNGCVYVVDWYDKRASHLDPRDNWDKTNGRIYRIVYGTRPKVAAFDLAKMSTDELLGLRNHKNDWWATEARRQLRERQDASIVPKLLTDLAAENDEVIALRDLWMINAVGKFDETLGLKLLDHPIAGVRRWVLRLLGDAGTMNEQLNYRLTKLAQNDPDATVRCQLAASCQRWKASDSAPILAALLNRDEDSKDEHIPLMLWWALEKQWRNDSAVTLKLFTTPAVQATQIGRGTILERAVRLLASIGTPATDEALGKLITESIASKNEKLVISGLEQGLQGRSTNAIPAALGPPLAELARFDPMNLALIRSSVRLGSKSALENARLMLTTVPPLPDQTRLAMIDVISIRPEAESEVALLSVVMSKPSDAVLIAGLNALGKFRSEQVTMTLIELYPIVKSTARDPICQVLASRKESAMALVEALEAKKIPAKELKAQQVVQIAGYDPKLAARIEALWGKIPGPNSEAKRGRIAEIRGLLPEGDKGVASRGAPVFKENCATCHKLFNEGEQIGPELTGSERGNLDFLLSSLVDPSAVIRKEYQSQALALTDGRIITGLVLEETANTVTIIDSNRQKTTIPRGNIEAMKHSDVSLMPEGLLDKLKDEQIRDLFKYLQSSGPPK